MDPHGIERLDATNTAGYPAPVALTVEPVVFAPYGGNLSLLIVREKVGSADRYSLPGGFVGMGEDPQTTAERKLYEQTGVASAYLEQLMTYADPAQDPRGWICSIAYLALVPATLLGSGVRRGKEPSWQPITKLPELEFGHAAIVADGIERLRGKLWYSSIALSLLPRTFTMPEARLLYEAISGFRYEPSNFRRELVRSGLVADTGTFRQGRSGRPAKLYEPVHDVPVWNSRRSRVPARILPRNSSS